MGSKKKLRVLLAGYYGFDNFGDEALLETTRVLLEKSGLEYGLEPDISVLDNQSREGLQSVPRFNFFKVLKAIRKSRLIVFGGGGIFQNQTSNRSLFYYLALVWLARLLRKRVILLGVGLVPITGFFQKIAALITLYGLPITVRDRESKNFLNSFRIQATLSSDLLFNSSATGLELAGTSAAKVFLNVRSFSSDADDLGFSAVVRYLSGKNVAVTALSLAPEDTVTLKKKFRHHNIVTDFVVLNKSPYEFHPHCRQGGIVLGMRLHSLIVATLYRIPFIGISLDPKIRAFAAEADFPVYTLSNPELIPALEKMLETPEEYSKKIDSALERFRKRAIQNENLIKRIFRELKEQ
ncbi:MAG: polysaccharide pyruvyl transferase family protein [Candidatus Wallbacteria bacterium]|nr:polysaccharide pyruvyl transferase family protein [Candidatus Wallbacteria bacterium]